jgi:hypothetical protein
MTKTVIRGQNMVFCDSEKPWRRMKVRKTFLSKVLGYWDLQSLKVSAWSVEIILSVGDFRWNYSAIQAYNHITLILRSFNKRLKNWNWWEITDAQCTSYRRWEKEKHYKKVMEQRREKEEKKMKRNAYSSLYC